MARPTVSADVSVRDAPAAAAAAGPPSAAAVAQGLGTPPGVLRLSSDPSADRLTSPIETGGHPQDERAARDRPVRLQDASFANGTRPAEAAPGTAGHALTPGTRGLSTAQGAATWATPPAFPAALMLGDLPDGSGIPDGDAAAGDPRGGGLGAALAASGGGTGSIATTGAGPGAAPHGGPGGAIAQQVGQHLGEAMRAGPGGGRLDVTLQPEDLGRLRLVFTPTESGLTVAVSADRPETLDLLRRNIDLLAGDLAQQGFTDVAFQFGAGDGNGQGETEGRSGMALHVVGEDSDARPGGAVPDATGGAAAGLDLRL